MFVLFTDEVIEARRGQATWPASLRRSVVELGGEPRYVCVRDLWFAPAPPVFTYCIVNGVYLSPLILKLHVPSSVSFTHSTKLDSRKQWQFYLHLYLFIIVSGTFWKFNNVCVQLNAIHIFFSLRLWGFSTLTPIHEGILWWLGYVILILVGSFFFVFGFGSGASYSAKISGGQILCRGSFVSWLAGRS